QGGRNGGCAASPERIGREPARDLRESFTAGGRGVPEHALVKESPAKRSRFAGRWLVRGSGIWFDLRDLDVLGPGLDVLGQQIFELLRVARERIAAEIGQELLGLVVDRNLI